MIEDTIVALSTAPLPSAIAVVRLSGKQTFDIVNRMVEKPLSFQRSRDMFYRVLFDEEKRMIDDAVITLYRDPHSYTGEDVAEISTHGNLLIVNQVISLCLSYGARLATPGEFTKKAYYHGKLDLIQAESIRDVIEARTLEAKDLALLGLKGNVSTQIHALKKQLLSLMAEVEVNLDYPEYEDFDQLNASILLPRLMGLQTEMKIILQEAQVGKTIRDGVKVAIVGLPNVGKSSLLNALIKEEKAIVTEIAGTTRDVVEGNTVIRGIPFFFLDTAGIRDSDDRIEKIGIGKSYQTMKEADLIIMVVDASRPLSLEEERLLKRVEEKPHLIVYNKKDIANDSIRSSLSISAKYNDLGDLENKMVEAIGIPGGTMQNLPRLSNIRQIGLLKRSLQAIDSALLGCKEKRPLDLLAVDIEDSLVALYELLGEQVRPDLDDEIFSRFCIGK